MVVFLAPYPPLVKRSGAYRPPSRVGFAGGAMASRHLTLAPTPREPTHNRRPARRSSSLSARRQALKASAWSATQFALRHMEATTIELPTTGSLSTLSTSSALALRVSSNLDLGTQNLQEFCQPFRMGGPRGSRHQLAVHLGLIHGDIDVPATGTGNIRFHRRIGRASLVLDDARGGVFRSRWVRIFSITWGSSMQAMILTAPPQAGQVWMSMPNTRFRRCA